MTNFEGQIQILNKNGQGPDDEEFQRMAELYQGVKDTAGVADGHVKCLTYLIKEIDMEEQELNLVNPFEKVLM